MMSSLPSKSSQGAALVLAMLIVAMVTAISVELTWRFDLASTRSGNRWYGMQANSYLEGAEEMAKHFLKQDLKNTVEVDNLAEDWNDPMAVETDEGFIMGQLEDANRRFNLNSLVDSSESPEKRRQRLQRDDAGGYLENQRRFIRLLQVIPVEEEVFLDEETARNITNAVVDWIDVDSEVTRFGAESDYYSGLDIPYTIANKPMVSVSELRVIKYLNELPQSFFEKLYPLVIALPADVKINVNTAPPEILRSLNRKSSLQPLRVDEVQGLLDVRGDELESDGSKGFTSVGEFVSQIETLLGISSGANANANNGFDNNYLDVKSSYFILSSETEVGDRVRRSRSMLQRVSEDQVLTLRRTNANF